jgi:ribonuclease HI
MPADYTIYTDGGCQPNPGPGGWAAIVLHQDRLAQELSGRDAVSTNNRMEITAALRALESLPDGSSVDLITDSTYLKNGITQWIAGWRRRGWLTAAKEPVKNQDLWRSLDSAAARHRINWRWTKGHAGNRWNERADELATAARGGGTSATSSGALASTRELPVDDQDAVHAYLGVAWSGKQKSGGWCAILSFEGLQRELSGRADGQSSNATHLLSALQTLDALKRPLPVHLYTVSDYLEKGVTSWLASWKRNQWRTASGQPVASRELWQDLDDRLSQLRRGGYVLTWHVVARESELPLLQEARILARKELDP